MADISITDNLGNPVSAVHVNLESTSSIFHYLKAESMHLTVMPEFLQAADQNLSQAAPKPIEFQLKVGHSFQLGIEKPEIDIGPAALITVGVNAAPGSNVFENDPFAVPATVPDRTGYVSLSLAGTLNLGISGSAGDLTFGLQSNSGITIEFLKAFALGTGGLTVGDALGRVISGYVIPARVADLWLLDVNDIATVSGQGSLKVSGSFDVTTPVNPLASVHLPLGTGTLAVKDGVMAGVAASLTLSGSYQVRVRKLAGNAVELGYCKEKGSSLQTDLSASAGVQVELGSTDLIARLCHGINSDTNENDKVLNLGLAKDEAATLQSAIKSGTDRSLQASLDLALSTVKDDESAFLYQIQLDQLDGQSTNAVNRALHGDLSGLTAMEITMKADGTIAAGIKVLKSCVSKMRTNEISLRLNLLGLVNLVSLSSLMRNSEAVTDPVTGDLTISETVSGNSIAAISDPRKRQEALRKAMFDSVTVTTAYRASKSVAMPAFSSHNFHFALSESTSKKTLGDYLDWFVALHLLDAAGKGRLISQFAGGGESSCLLRSEFDDQTCNGMFFDSLGAPRRESDYIEIGRKALVLLLDPENSEVDQYRYSLLTDNARWMQAIKMGPVDALGSLLPISSSSSIYQLVLQQVEGDVYDIAWWASSMDSAAGKLQEMRQFLTTADPATLARNSEFANRRADLQKHMAGVIARSKVRFHQPWGFLALFLAAGGPNAMGRLRTVKFTLQRQVARAVSNSARP